uniref:PAS domain-containing protein n=1 Tax=Loktanella salsilacus TaxID=195913 RepID=UPI00356297B8
LFVDCNNSTLKLLGYENKNDVLLKLPSELSPENQPDGESSSIKANKIINQALEKGSQRFEWYHKKASGEIFPVEVVLTTINKDSKNLVLHTVWRDITKRKQAEIALKESEEKYRTIIEKSPIGIVHYTSEGVITDCNPKFCEIVGSPEETLIGPLLPQSAQVGSDG